MKRFFALLMLLSLVFIGCKTITIAGDFCPDSPNKSCPGPIQCEMDTRGCKMCICSPMYIERPPIEQYMTPIQDQ